MVMDKETREEGLNQVVELASGRLAHLLMSATQSWQFLLWEGRACPDSVRSRLVRVGASQGSQNGQPCGR